jgi:hypothetical protein
LEVLRVRQLEKVLRVSAAFAARLVKSAAVYSRHNNKDSLQSNERDNQQRRRKAN